MSDAKPDEKLDGPVRAVLEGGPSDIPPARRLIRDASDEPVIKIERLCGYEHFYREETDSEPVVYRWRMRTRIAE
jgi:hypothetical protein